VRHVEAAAPGLGERGARRRYDHCICHGVLCGLRN
jgi:hypothetical protein